jgi:predicted acetyltransferase
VKIEISPAGYQELTTLRNLFELYSHDFSEIDGADVDESGLYGYNFLDLYWTDPNRFPFLIRVDGRLAGFVLVRKDSYFPEIEASGSGLSWLIAEFFVMRKYRRMGIGKLAARELFDRFPGRWEVAQIEGNDAALLFWRKVIGEYTGGQYSEVVLHNDRWRGPVQVFNNKPE